MLCLPDIEMFISMSEKQSLYSDLRFCDVIELKYSNVDYSNKLLKFEPAKTKGHSSASNVIIPLSEANNSLPDFKI